MAETLKKSHPGILSRCPQVTEPSAHTHTQFTINQEDLVSKGLVMATTAHSFTPASSISSNSRALSKADCDTSSDSFPAGLRVLVVDDDPICLLILDRMLRRCQYKVTTCGRAAEALVMLRENRDNFDVIISDVYMPDMDGFKLLELVGLDMDLPVIMMSANGETSAVMKGIKHGACDYLLKPVRMEELRNIWQHVVRKKWRSSAQQVASEDDKSRQVADDGDHNSSANEGYDGTWKQSKKRRDVKEEDEDAELDPDDPSVSKKPRVVWSVELHQQFVNAVNQLGVDKAVPKRILELMNVHGLTRENVASHLQKYRLYLKRISGVAHQSGTLNPTFPVSADSNFGAAGVAGVGEFRGLSGSNDLSSQQALLSTLQAGVLGRLDQANNLGIGNMDNANILQIAALQGAGSGALGRPPFLPSYGQPALNDQTIFQFGQCDMNPIQLAPLGTFSGVSHEKVPLGLSALQQQQQQLEAVSSLGGMEQLGGVSNNFQQVNPNTNVLVMQALQQQQQINSHLMSKGGLTMSTSGNVGQPGLSTDAGVWATAISSLNGNIRLGSGMAGQYSGSPKFGCIPSVVGSGSASTIPGPLGRVADVECKGQQRLSTDAGVWGASVANLNATSNVGSGISGQNSGLLEFGSGACSDPDVPAPLERTIDTGNVTVVSSLTVSSSMSIPGPDSLPYTRMKNVGSSLSSLNATSLQSLGSRFPLLSGLKQTSLTGQRSQGAWQGFGAGQDYGQVTNNALQSPRFSRGSSGRQSLRLLTDQEQGEPRGPGCSSSSNYIDCVRGSQTEHLRAESGAKIRSEGHGWIPESLSDELLSIVLRQQQEGLRLTE
eukprot:c24473_g1_i3 orf=779-3274(-)